jgi:hypothetical protein
VDNAPAETASVMNLPIAAAGILMRFYRWDASLLMSKYACGGGVATTQVPHKTVWCDFSGIWKTPSQHWVKQVFLPSWLLSEIGMLVQLCQGLPQRLVTWICALLASLTWS